MFHAINSVHSKRVVIYINISKTHYYLGITEEVQDRFSKLVEKWEELILKAKVT